MDSSTSVVDNARPTSCSTSRGRSTKLASFAVRLTFLTDDDWRCLRRLGRSDPLSSSRLSASEYLRRFLSRNCLHFWCEDEWDACMGVLEEDRRCRKPRERLVLSINDLCQGARLCGGILLQIPTKWDSDTGLGGVQWDQRVRTWLTDHVFGHKQDLTFDHHDHGHRKCARCYSQSRLDDAHISRAEACRALCSAW